MRFIIGYEIVEYNAIPAKTLPGSRINFDEASKLWRKNKISIGNGLFQYKLNRNIRTIII